MIFIDGLGIGAEDASVNPLFKYKLRTFNSIFGATPSLNNPVLQKDDAYIFPVDACMGVEGLPQSGTGQTSIFCGVNAQRELGFHFGPFPHSKLIPIIREKNILKYFSDKGLPVSFVNAYPQLFFDYIAEGKKRISVTSLMCRLNGMKLNNVKDLRTGEALSAEIDNWRWVHKMDYNLPVIKPEIAAKRLLKISSSNSFTLFEFFLTDHLGHGRIQDSFSHIIETLDGFLYSLISEMDRKNMTLIICSDHGNFEDMSVKTHTLNPSFTLSCGFGAADLAGSITRLSDIKDAVTSLI
jgi:hypothetical protein